MTSPALRAAPAALALLAALAPRAGAQAPSLSAEVRRYVSVAEPVVALTGVRLLDGTGAPARDAQTILIEAGRIRAVGPAGRVAIPRGARVLDLPGHTVIPGLVGMHNHMFYTTPQGSSVQMTYTAPRLYLGSGVTTVRTTGSFSPYAELNLKAGIDRGEIPGPRMHITAPYLISPGPNAALSAMGMQEVRTEEDARRTVRYWAAEGAEWIKGYTQLSRAVFRAVIDEAHRQGMKVTGHLCSISFTEAVALGIDNIEHGFRTNSDYDRAKRPDECPPTHYETLAALDMDDPRIAETFRAMVAAGVGMTTTTVNEELAPGRPGPDRRTLEAMAPWIAERELQRRAWLDAGRPEGETYPLMGAIYPKSQAYELAFVRAGGVLAAGVDPAFGTLPGFGDQRNLELFVEAGFTVAEAVQIISANGARILGVLDQRGTVEPGKLADLVVLAGDLVADPGAIRRPVTVFKDGVGYDPARLIAAVRGQVGIR
jgi:imidazolonepropionase-like amidohydrolase